MGIIIAIIILCVVILVHELGHFLAAKASGIIVDEFAFGMGPKLLSFRKGDTLYAWRLIPIGGMCMMRGEDAEDHSEGSFQSAKVWKRIIVVAAGPLFNVLLAFIAALIVVFCAGADPCNVVSVTEGSPAQEAGLQEGDLIVSFEGSGISNARELYLESITEGISEDNIIDLIVERDGQRLSFSFGLNETQAYLLGFTYVSNENEPAEIKSVNEGYPMQEAGLQAGDIITSVNGVSIETSEELNEYFDENPLDGSSVEIVYERDGIDDSVTLTPVESVSTDGGFSYNMAREKQDFFGSVKYAFGEIKYNVKSSLSTLGGLFTGRYSVSELSGPVGIVSVVDEVYEKTAEDGVFSTVMSMLNMLILLSISVGVLNLLPLPALDGGRLIFLFVECIRRKPCDQRIEGIVHLIGMAAILALAAYVAFNDILRLF